MLLGNLIKSANKKYRNTVIKGVSFDSRKIKKGDIFFAILGKKESGNKFIDEAISKGASAVVSNKFIKNKYFKAPLITVKDTRKSLAEACSNFYKKKPKNIVAVTGTNGKSSVADFFYQILKLNKVPVASIGTLGIISKKYRKKTSLTSVDPLLLHQSLQILKKNKVNNVILEASSHGLDQKRIDNLDIKTGIFTNFSHDHLDYHKNYKNYFNSKMHLFKNILRNNSKIISDQNNKEFKIIKSIAKKKKIKITSIGQDFGDIRILSNSYKDNNQVIRILVGSKFFLLEIPLIGYFQIKNLLMAVLAARNCGIKQKKIFNQLKKIKPVPGRLECVSKLNKNSKIIIDFAHTPDALEQSLKSIKKQFKSKIIVVFGCGGERDEKKRKLMGLIAKKYCRKIFVTDDNPRNENPKKIRREIIQGCKKSAVEIGNRKEAIRLAINEMGPKDILLVAGKGHENTQDYGNRTLNFSDKKVIKAIIKKKIYSFKKKKSNDSLLKKVFSNKKLKNINYNGVSINTKTTKKNDLFFAIRGKNNDGHNYIKEALKKGACKLIISKQIKNVPKNKTIQVKNTLLSLNNLAKITRDNTLAKIIGITGSVGKTTLKNLISFTLKRYGKVYQSPHSYNNKFGVPYSLSNLKNNINYGVFEIGMDKKGEINKLSSLVKPEIAVITNIGEAHFKNFKSLKDIAKAKSEIIDNISDDGHLVLNKDDKFYKFFFNKGKKNNVNIISYSLKRKTDIFLNNIKKINKIYRLNVIVKGETLYFDTFNTNQNILNNILACISVLSLLNINLKKLKKIFTRFSLPEGRGDIKTIKKFKKIFKFVDESYNANPLSMNSAINNINKIKMKGKSKKLILLGDMKELGSKSIKLHKKLSISINKSNIDKVFVYGKDIKSTFSYLSKNKKGKIFKNLQEAYEHIGKIVNNNDLFMVKGSNSTGLNQFSKNIKR